MGGRLQAQGAPGHSSRADIVYFMGPQALVHRFFPMPWGLRLNSFKGAGLGLFPTGFGATLVGVMWLLQEELKVVIVGQFPLGIRY